MFGRLHWRHTWSTVATATCLFPHYCHYSIKQDNSFLIYFRYRPSHLDCLTHHNIHNNLSRRLIKATMPNWFIMTQKLNCHWEIMFVCVCLFPTDQWVNSFLNSRNFDEFIHIRKVTSAQLTMFFTLGFVIWSLNEMFTTMSFEYHESLQTRYCVARQINLDILSYPCRASLKFNRLQCLKCIVDWVLYEQSSKYNFRMERWKDKTSTTTPTKPAQPDLLITHGWPSCGCHWWQVGRRQMDLNCHH